MELKTRDQMNPDYTWNLEDMIPNQDTWQSLFDDVAKLADDIAAMEGTILNSAETLYKEFQLSEELSTKLMRLYVFSNMTLHQDTSNAAAQEMVQKINGLQVEVSSKLSFVEPEIMSGDSATLLSYIDSKRGTQVIQTSC